MKLLLNIRIIQKVIFSATLTRSKGTFLQFLHVLDFGASSTVKIFLSPYLLLEGGGGSEAPLAELAIAPNRIYISIWKFLTFLIYQKPKF